MILPSELPGLAELLDHLPTLADLDLAVEGSPAGPILRSAARRPGNLATDQHDTTAPQEGTK